MNEKFLINNKLLIQAICGGTKCKYAPLEKSTGYLFYDDEHIGRAILEYCYSIIFNIRRFPGYESFYLHNMPHIDKNRIIKEKDIKDACNQLEELYEFTQNNIRKIFNLDIDSKYMPLVRSLNFEEINSMRKLDANTLEMDANIISSYAYSNQTSYKTHVKIKRNVPIEDILMIDFATEYLFADYQCDYKVYKGESEIWVLNRDMYGKIFISPNDIIEDPEHRININTITKREKPLGFSQLVDTNFLKPCECGKFTKWIIRKNLKEIEELDL